MRWSRLMYVALFLVPSYLMAQTEQSETEILLPSFPEYIYPQVFVVDSGGTAYKAGMQSGDLITLISGIVPRNPAQVDLLLAYGPSSVSVIRDSLMMDLTLGIGMTGIITGGPEVHIAPHSVLLDQMNASDMTAGLDPKVAAWYAIARYFNRPVEYNSLLVLSGIAFWSSWYDPGASITSIRADASWFDRKLAEVVGVSTISGNVNNASIIARTSLNNGFPSVASSFGGHGTVLIAGYDLYSEALYGYNSFGQLVGATSCSTVIAVTSLNELPDISLITERTITSVASLMYMREWRPVRFDEQGRPEEEVYSIGPASFENWAENLSGDNMPVEGTTGYLEMVSTSRKLAGVLAERRSAAAEFFENLAVSLSESVYSRMATLYSDQSEILEPMSTYEAGSELSTTTGRDHWLDILESVLTMEERATALMITLI